MKFVIFQVSRFADWFHAKILNVMKAPPGILLLAASASGAVEQAHSLNRMLRKLKSWKSIVRINWRIPPTNGFSLYLRVNTL